VQKPIVKKTKDPNAPRRPATAYLEFVRPRFPLLPQNLLRVTAAKLTSASRAQVKVRRPQIIAENPSIAFTQVGKMLGEEWRGMSDWKKNPFHQKAAQSKALYDRQMEQYRATTSFVPEVISSKTKKTKDPAAPKRPVSAFLEYVRQSGKASFLHTRVWPTICLPWRHKPRSSTPLRFRYGVCTEQSSPAGNHRWQPGDQAHAGWFAARRGVA
jgi:hypothetical protein